MKSKLTQKIKTSVLSIFMAIAMMLSANFSSIYAVSNFARYASAAENKYAASSTVKFTFDSAESTTQILNGVSGHYSVNRSASILDAYNSVSNKTYFPIVKYNGFSALTAERDSLKNENETALDADKADTYYGVISTNEYQVARKEYTKKNNEYVLETEKIEVTENAGTADEKVTISNKNVVYISASKLSDETDTQFNERIESLKSIISVVNAKYTTKSGNVIYKYLDTNTETNESYDNSDYQTINTESDQYSTISTDFEGQKLAGSEENINLTSYTLQNKKTYEYVENVLGIKTNKTISLTNNSYYVVSVWVYTAGKDDNPTTATIAVTGTNFNAQIENINTNGVWVQYYLFIETPVADSTNITVSLYYGDSYGVTGTKSLNDFSSDTETPYKDTTITGTVAFDQLKIDQINQTEYVNMTINDYSYKDIAKANLAETYRSEDKIGEIKNNKKATATEEDGTTTYTYQYATYSSLSDISVAERFSARFTHNYEYGSFQGLTGQDNDDLVYQPSKNEFNYDSYQDNDEKYFTYYMPRYSEDDSSRELVLDEKNAYRDRYYTNSGLIVSVVTEGEEFEAYSKDKYDELGNLVEKVTEGEESSSDSNDDEENKYEQIENVKNNTFITTPNGTNDILKLENKTSYKLGVVSRTIHLPTHAYYRVSVWVYSSDKEATATVKLFSTLKEKTSLKNGTLVIAEATATDFEYNSNSTNGWQEISFVVQGNPYQDCELNLAMLASANATVYFDNIKVENISSSTYSSGSHKLDLSSKAVLSSNISNGRFNSITVSNADTINSYPYVAQNWTIVSDDTSDNVISGVVTNNQTVWNNKVIPAYGDDGELEYYDQDYITWNGTNYIYNKTGEASNLTLVEGVNYLKNLNGKFLKTTTLANLFGTSAPVTTINDLLPDDWTPSWGDETLPDSNVYGVYLPAASGDDEKSSFLMKSSSMSFSSVNVYKLTFQTWIGDNFDGKIVAKLVYDSKNITEIEFDVTDDVAKNTWQTFTIYIRTGSSSRSSITLQLGAKESEGSIFFQNVNYSSLSETTKNGKTVSVDEQFTQLLQKYPTIESRDAVTGGKINCVRFVDFGNNNFTMHSNSINDETGIYDSYGYILAEKGSDDKYTQGTVGVTTTNNSTFEFDGTTVTVSQNPQALTDTALLIKNEETTDYTVVSNKFSNTLSTKKYYKLTFYVKTSDMGDKGLKVLANGLTDDNGVTESFDNINTSTYSENGGWKQYTIYVSVGSSSISSFNLSFSLGTDDNESFTGWALISSINLEEIDEDLYTEETEKEEVKNDDSIMIKQLKVEEDEDDDEEDDDKFSWATFFLVFSSILLVVSLTVALVAVLIKRKAKKNSVDAAAEGGIESNKDQDLGGIE